MKYRALVVAAVLPLILPSLAAAQEIEPAGSEPRSAAEIEGDLLRVLARPGGLKAEEVARRATATSPNIRAKRAQVAAASAEQDRAVVGWFPRLTLTARYTRLSPVEQPAIGPEEGFNFVGTTAGEGPLPPGAPLVGIPRDVLVFPVVLDNYLLQAGVTVPLSDYVLRTSQAQSAASRSRRAAELSERAVRASVAANAKIAYWAWVRARLQRVVASQTLAQTKTHLDAARALAQADRASNADVLAAEAQLASAELLVERAESFEAVSEDRVRNLMHESAARRYQVGENPLGPLPPPTPRVDVRTLISEAYKQRLELRALDENDRALREQKSVARSTSYPRLDAFGNAYYANPNPRVFPQREEWRATWDVGVQLTWTPNDVALGSADTSALEAKRAEVAAQRSELRDALRTEVFEAYQALREAEIAVKTSARRLASAEEAYRVRAERFRYGRASFVELTDAETELLRARLERIDARIGVKTAQVRLDHALGRDVAGR